MRCIVADWHLSRVRKAEGGIEAYLHNVFA